MFSTYIIYSEKLDQYYVGSTQNINQRLEHHNNGDSKFTSRGIPWVLKWNIEFDTRPEAIQEELRIKRMKSRKYIIQLISSSHY